MKYGLIGEKLGHSFSKTIHGLIGSYDYELVEIPSDGIDSFLTRKDFLGINVTIPYKERVIPFLDEVGDEVKKIGACNTVVCKDGVLYGYNTDYYGLRDLILFNGIDISGKKVLILGTGGTCKTAKALVSDMGAGMIKIASRRTGMSPDTLTYDELYQKYPDAQVIINTTPCGMYPNNGNYPVELEIFKELESVVDVIYNPLRSNLVLEARERGIKATGGLYMLVSQAVHASAVFFGKKVENDLTDEIFDKIFKEKENICLIGMPSAGKTTVGRMLAQKTGREFFDSDIVLERQTGMKISEIFATKGEEAFRKIESEVIADLSKKSSCVIATGGGVVLNPRNVRNLRQNSKLYFLDRNIDNLVATDDRPLSRDIDALRRMYEIRLPVYRKSCDVVIDGDNTIENIVKNILDN